MANEPCPQCSLNLYKVEQAEKVAKAAEDTAKAANVRVLALEGELGTAKAAEVKPPQVPSLMSLIAHCESGECGDHAKEWNDVKAKVIERIPDDYIRSRAAILGLIEKPKEPKTIRVAVG